MPRSISLLQGMPDALPIVARPTHFYACFGPEKLLKRLAQRLPKYLHEATSWQHELGVTPESVNPAKSMRNSPLGQLPILLLHGALDTITEKDQAIHNYHTLHELNPDGVQLKILPGGKNMCPKRGDRWPTVKPTPRSFESHPNI